jgi:hypothetical protein
VRQPFIVFPLNTTEASALDKKLICVSASLKKNDDHMTLFHPASRLALLADKALSCALNRVIAPTYCVLVIAVPAGGNI